MKRKIILERIDDRKSYMKHIVTRIEKCTDEDDKARLTDYLKELLDEEEFDYRLLKVVL